MHFYMLNHTLENDLKWILLLAYSSEALVFIYQLVLFEISRANYSQKQNNSLTKLAFTWKKGRPQMSCKLSQNV